MTKTTVRRPAARLGVLGGVFDPIHFGHLLAAEDAMRHLKLDRVLFVPTCRPPHKPAPHVTYRHRVAMARLAVAGQADLSVAAVEHERPGPSYTVDTLTALKELNPGASLYLLLGADQYREMPRWHQPRKVARLATIVVMSRPGTGTGPSPYALRVREDGSTWIQFGDGDNGDRAPTARNNIRSNRRSRPTSRVRFQQVIPVDISAAAIRVRLEAGASVEYLVPAAVADFIRTRQLYQARARRTAPNKEETCHV